MSVGKKILVVEDDFDIRAILVMILIEEGYEVSELDNGLGVNAEMHRSIPDLILLDVMLGDSDGRDICRELKNTETTRGIPIIIVSATHERFSAEEKGCNANDYLPKPFDVAELVRKVRLYAAA